MSISHTSALIAGIALLAGACATDTSLSSGAEPAEAVFQVSDNCNAAPNCFASVQSAIDAAAQMPSDTWRTVRVAAGDYREKIRIDADHIRLVGDARETTRIWFDAVAQTAGHYHRKNWGTPGSATLTINARDVEVSGLTIENMFDYRANDARQADDPAKIGNPQAAALLLDIDSDRVRLDHVALEGYQDTLFANGARAVISNSLISGNVDFIFGNGQLLIEDSEVRTRLRGETFPAGEVQSFIAAPSTQLSSPVGIVFHRSRLTREAGLPDASVTLGRPWHPTTVFPDGRYADPNAVGHTAFIDCWMDAHISPERWSSMNGTARNGEKTDVFQPQDSRFLETGSTGPGAHPADIGVTWTDFPSIEEIRAVMFYNWPQET